MPMKLARAKTKHIVEPNRETWLAQTRNDLYRVGFKSVDTLDLVDGKLVRLKTDAGSRIDNMIGMPNQPLVKKMPTTLIDPPTECQMCSTPFTDQIIDGVVKGARAWAFMCPDCHKTEGIGLGTGLGQLYQLQSNNLYTKVEG